MLKTRPTVFLLTDFGTSDQYVAVMKAVILSRCPDAQLVDISHEVASQDVEQGAYLLESTWQWLPDGAVVLAVVDPGVGSEREPAVFSHEGKCLVGPNNGLFDFLPAEVDGRVLDRPKFWLENVSATFHGRDVFAPCAAYLAAGGHWTRLGAKMARPVCVNGDETSGEQGHEGRIIHVDHFGNAITNIRISTERIAAQFVKLPTGQMVTVKNTYSDVRPGEPVAYVGSTGKLEIAVRNGSAREALTLSPGDAVQILPGNQSG